jgi:hypothetical protein
MREVRRRFHEELRALEGEVQRTGTQARLLLERALQALAGGDPAVCGEVIRGDDEVDQLYLDAERRILHLFALQTPVASDRFVFGELPRVAVGSFRRWPRLSFHPGLFGLYAKPGSALLGGLRGRWRRRHRVPVVVRMTSHAGRSQVRR